VISKSVARLPCVDTFSAMTRDQLIAAEMFAYSFENYESHLVSGHPRFEVQMPNTVRALESAENENWTDQCLAEVIEIDISKISQWRKRFRDAAEVIDAPNPATAFRNAVRQVLTNELARHQLGDAELESAVMQICIRVADLSYLLDKSNNKLSDYSNELMTDA